MAKKAVATWRKLSLVLCGLGLVLVIGDAVFTLARWYPTLIREHLTGIAGGLLAFGSGAAWLARRRRKSDLVDAVSSGADLKFVSANPLAVRALQWVDEQVDSSAGSDSGFISAWLKSK